MPEGLVRTDLNKTGTSFKNGIPVTEPVTYGTPIVKPHQFGITIPVSDKTTDSNPVTWAPTPSHFGNIFASSAPVSFVSQVTKNANNVSTVTTNAVNTTGANFLVALVFQNSYQTGQTVVTDSLSNTWYAVTLNSPQAAFPNAQIFYAYNAIVGATQTFTVTTANSQWASLSIMSFAGVKSISTPFETGVNSAYSFSGGTTQQPGSITPTSTGDLIITAVGGQGATGNTASINQGFTIEGGLIIDAVEFGAGAYLISPAGAAVNPTWTLTPGVVFSMACIATFAHS